MMISSWRDNLLCLALFEEQYCDGDGLVIVIHILLIVCERELTLSESCNWYDDHDIDDLLYLALSEK